MGAITYAALREFEPTGYSKTGLDISAAASDDSFDSVSTVLTGLNTDEWALVAGFAASANNGWFQVKSNSAAAKILQVTPPISHLRLPAVAGNNASTPDTSANSVTGDLELRVKAALTDWTPASIQTLFAKWGAAGQRSYALSVNTDGTLNLSWSADGTTVISKNSTVATGIADLALKFARATLDVNNGAAGNDVKFYLSPDGATWTQLGATVTTAGTTAVFNSTAPLEVGSMVSGTSQLASARIYSALLLNGLAGTVVASFNAALGVRNGTTIVASTGETWTINQSGTPAALLQGSPLVTAAAGPSVSIAGYKRGLGQNYNLEFYSGMIDRSVKVMRTSHQPLGGGAPETLLQRRETYVDVTVIGPNGDGIPEASMPQWREFLASVEGGEPFIYDRYGTIASPVEPKSAMLSSDGYQERRIDSIRSYTLAFQVRLLT